MSQNKVSLSQKKKSSKKSTLKSIKNQIATKKSEIKSHASLNQNNDMKDVESKAAEKFVQEEGKK